MSIFQEKQQFLNLKKLATIYLLKMHMHIQSLDRGMLFYYIYIYIYNQHE